MDALSRLPPTAQLASMTAPKILDLEVIRTEVTVDPHFAKVIADLHNGPDSIPQISLHQGMLKYKNRLVLSKSSSVIPTILHTYHDLVMGGHSGFLNSYKRLIRELYYPGMNTDTKSCIEKCTTCERNKTMAASPVGLLQPLQAPDQYGTITMGFVESLQKSLGNDTCFVVVNRPSKYAHFIPVCHPFSTKTIEEIFILGIIRLHGFPFTIISERDKVLLSHFWTELFRL